MRVARLERLAQRALINRAIRGFFDDQVYLEVEPPVLVTNPGLEPHLDAFEVTRGTRRYLHTSPEYALKRLLGEGAQRLFALSPCFRDEPPSRSHAPQFTMLEWYTVGASLAELMTQTEALIHSCANAVGAEVPRGFQRITVQQAFVQHAGIDPFQWSDGLALRTAARAAGLAAPTDSEDWDSVFFQVFLNHVEPKLGQSVPTFLTHYPASQAALARLDPDDPRFALRFELFGGGFELANAFDELIDVDEQRRRFEADQHERRVLGRPVYPIDEALMEALSRMSPTVGIALGVDRLVMWLTGATDIAEVQAQSW